MENSKPLTIAVLSNQPYRIPAYTLEAEEVVNKSKFITHISHTDDVTSAKVFIEQVKQRHPKANHNCWAYIAGPPTDSLQYGCSDDGEPTGTAGKPMLAHLTGSKIGEITAVVTRYFGGIKLGTGGLVKAYGNAVKSGIEALVTTEKTITAVIVIKAPYPLQGLIESYIAKSEGWVIARDFSQDLVVSVEMDARMTRDFRQALISAGKGRIEVAVKNK